MALLVTDPDLEMRLLNERRIAHSDRFDEVWEGTYVMAPLANNEHQDLQLSFGTAFRDFFGWDSSARIYAGANVSDRNEDWVFNYRCPDVVVYLPGNPAVNRGTHWQGGPDFLVEIVSVGDRSEEKLPFCAGVGVREALIVHRKPWKLELYRNSSSTTSMQLIASSTLDPPAQIKSDVLPVTFQLMPDSPRPKIQLARVSKADPGVRTSWLL